MITILDKGPSAPLAPDDKDDAAAVAAHKAAVKEHDDWHEAHKEPVEVQMHPIDGRHAIAADPERYSEVRRDVILRKSGSLEDRVTALEDRLYALENQDDAVDEPSSKPAPVLEPERAKPLGPYVEEK